MPDSIEVTIQKPSPAAAPGLFDRVSSGLERFGLTPLGVALLLVLAVLPFIPPFNQEHLLRWLVGAALIAAQAIAFDFTAGYINIVNFAFAAFMGLGAYTSALLVVNFGISPWLGIFLGALPAGLLGFFLGLLTLRLRGIYAAVMAWFVGLALLGLARNLVDVTRGPAGLSAPLLLESSSNLPYFYIIFVMMIITYLVLKRITLTRYGLAFRAIGQNIDAARASGINPTRYRVFNFTVQCLFAGWLGGFYAHYIGILTPQVMSTSRTVEVLAIAYIGGRGSIWGGAFVAFPFIFFNEWLRSSLSNLPGVHLVIYGLLLILVMVFYPGGVAQFYYTIKNRFKKDSRQPAD